MLSGESKCDVVEVGGHVPKVAKWSQKEDQHIKNTYLLLPRLDKGNILCFLKIIQRLETLRGQLLHCGIQGMERVQAVRANHRVGLTSVTQPLAASIVRKLISH